MRRSIGFPGAICRTARPIRFRCGDLIAPAVVIDCSKESAADADFLLTPDFIKAWEAQHGKIPPRCWVLMRTDWSKKTDPAAYQNFDETRAAHARARSGRRAISAERARRARLRHRNHRHRRRAGGAFPAALSVPLLHARRRTLRPAMPDQSRSAAADRKFADRAAAEDPARQRQPVARAGAGAFESGGSRGGHDSRRPPAWFHFRRPTGRCHACSKSRPQPWRPHVLSAAGGSWTFREARDVAAGRAAALPARGVSAGDRVAILCSNRIEMLEIVLGCGWIGAIAVPINTAAMGPQIAYCLSNSGARLLVIEAQFVDRLAHGPKAWRRCVRSG